MPVNTSNGSDMGSILGMKVNSFFSVISSMKSSFSLEHKSVLPFSGILQRINRAFIATSGLSTISSTKIGTGITSDKIMGGGLISGVASSKFGSGLMR